MKKLRLLLLDANVVIELFRLGIWDRFIDVCDVHLSGIVIEDEALFYEDRDGSPCYLQLPSYVEDGKITRFDVGASDIEAFVKEYGSIYLEKLDPGESESLAYLFSSSEEFTICSSDKIVFRVLGSRQLSHRGVSLEELLDQTGLGRPLRRQFTKHFREDIAKQGFQEGFSGLAFKTEGPD